ncbi:MAG: aminoacetone oxidase family FAD-binding enzyme [Candidatus Sericytochromatia bacterium]|nr:aminoacetone oxidase family FAD-binding enzyme [Candidatus Sericytochromatia bacterium]
MSRAKMANDTWDVTVVGGGAAGMLAALEAARAGARTLLLEKTVKLGTKIRISGGGRCNVTNALDDLRAWERMFPGNGPFLRHALRSYPPRAFLDLLHGEGVPTRVEAPYGKIFPDSGKSGDVIDALVRAMRRAGVTLATETPARDILRDGAGSVRGLGLDGGAVLPTRSVVWCTGGRSFPKSGSTGDGYPILRRLGHTVVPTFPSLVPLRLSGTAPHAGVALRGIRGRVRLAGQAGPVPWDGDVLWTHFGLSGPVVLQLSRALAASWVQGETTGDLLFDLLPGESQEDVLKRLLGTMAREGGRTVRSLVPETVPRALVTDLLDAAGVPGDRRLAELGRQERRRLAETFKGWAFRPEGWHSFEAAEVTAGGVDVREVDPKTMASRRVPGLYLAGEILDVDGYVGGYNLQAAWSTGFLAGRAAAVHARACRDGSSSATIR